MRSPNIRDLLTSFSPSLDLFAISSGDGRIKIWDAVKGQIQTEFADITTNDATNIYSRPERGHLSIDYTCMKWLSPEKKKKRKHRSSLLVLGTGSGDVLALDVSAGQLKWRVSDCHPGGVSAISFPAHGSSIYTAGADGMVCEIDSLTGNLSKKLKASEKAISCMSISSDGKILATAAAQLKTFTWPEQKKIQKFSGHPGAVRCMIFTEDGKYILSSAVGERYLAIWKSDGSKKQSVSCVLAMDHPAVFLDCKHVDGGGATEEGLYVLAILEIGICYYWYGQNLEELRNAKPAKVSLSQVDVSSKNYSAGLPTIFAAKLQGISKPGAGQVFFAHGLLVKPLFQKIVVHSGTDVKLNSSHDGVLLPTSQSVGKSKKGLHVQSGVTALDCANAEDAVLPIPKVFDSHEKSNIHQNLRVDPDEDDLIEVDSEAICMEDKLRSLGLLNSKDDLRLISERDSTILKGINLEANVPQKKLMKTVSLTNPEDAQKLLEILVTKWQSRSCNGKYVLPWIYGLLLTHSQHVMSQGPATQMLDSLLKIAKSRRSSVQQLLQLSGRLQLVTAQFDRASHNKTQTLKHGDLIDSSENEEDDDVDDVLYGEEEYESEISDDEN